MKKLVHLLLALLPVLGNAQTQANLLYHWHDPNITPTSWLDSRYNETWGFARDGREYGVIGTTDGMRIFDVTDPLEIPEPIAVAGAANGANIIHRDMKNFGDFLYAVCDEGASTLQIVDLSKLPDEAKVVYSSNEFITTAHNLYLDTAQQRLYLLGAGSSTKILDIRDRAKPKLLGSHPSSGFNLPYVHDAYIHNHIGLMNCGNSGFWVVDFSNPTSPVTLGTMTNYPGSGYNHSGWVTADGRHYALCDETHGSPVKMIDMADFEDLKVVSSMNPSSFAGQIPHNALVRDNLLYVSYYYDGLQVFDISEPTAPKRVLYYDTYPGANQNSYAGSWGVNPNLPSGNILLSDLNTGFWLFGPADAPKDYQLRTNHPFLYACEGQTPELRLTVGKNFTSQTMVPSVKTSGGIVPVLNTITYKAGDVIPIRLQNLTVGHHTIEASISDGTHTGKSLIHLFVKAAPATAPALTQPTDAAANQALTPVLKWDAVAGTTTYQVEISTAGGSDFDQNIFYTKSSAGTTLLLNAANLKQATTYFWRVSIASVCGKVSSQVFSFITKSTISTVDLAGSRVEVFPNPMGENLTLKFEKATVGETRVELWNAAGQRVVEYILPTGGSQVDLPVQGFSAGQYLLILKNGEQVGQTFLIKN